MVARIKIRQFDCVVKISANSNCAGSELGTDSFVDTGIADQDHYKRVGT